jgi:tripartite-type tricarboxylate transporter receptor subunit TctC
LESGVRAMLADATVKERLDALAFEPAGQTRGAFAAFMKAEIAKWTQVARAAGAKAD